MKKIMNIQNKACSLLGALCLLCVLGTSCTDTWNEHYDVSEGGMADQPTLLENIKADRSLENFYQVLASIGAEDMLKSPQQLTVWAPRNLTQAQADSIIEVYRKDKTDYEARYGRTQKWADNKAITQFLQNHVALYSRPVSSLTDDTISMMNRKYMRLVGTSSETGTLDGNPFDEAVVSSNGMLYKTNRLQHFFPNVREYLEQHEGLDSIVHLLVAFDEYELDEASSVSGDVVDGKTQYLDSVMVLSNDLLSRYGYIQREDSTYTLIAPTNALWEKLYDEYKAYYTYSPTVLNADSLMDINTKKSIVQGRFFNTSSENRYNRHPQDSLVNTSYTERQSHNPRRNVYYKPFASDGIFAGLPKVDCSNGAVYVDDKGVIDPRTTFFYRSDIPCTYGQYYEVNKDSKNDDKMNVTNNQRILTRYIYTDDSTAVEVDRKTYDYVEVTAKTSSEHTEIIYKLPSTYSGMYYNIYVVTVPAFINQMPCWFQVKHSEKNNRGTFTNAASFTNPHPYTLADSLTVPNVSVLLEQSNNQRCYVASANRVDTILIQSAYQVPYSSVGLDDETARLTIGSFGPSSPTYREKIYTRTLRLNEIILVPFATKEEAEAAADDKDAFNDEKLEANKEN